MKKDERKKVHKHKQTHTYMYNHIVHNIQHILVVVWFMNKIIHIRINA